MTIDPRPSFFLGVWTRHARVGLAGFLSLSIASLPAFACCDDVLSCAAAVATGGLSCVAEVALKEITDTIKQLQDHRRTAVAQFSSTLDPQIKANQSELDQITAEINQLLEQISQAAGSVGIGVTGGTMSEHAEDAQVAGGTSSKVTNAPGAKASGKNKSSYGGSAQIRVPQELENSPFYAALNAELKELLAKKRDILMEMGLQKAKATAEMLAASARAEAAFGEGFLDQVDGAIAALGKLRDHPLDIGNDIAQALTLLDSAEGAFIDVVTPAIDQASNDIEGAIKLPVSFLLAIEKEARRADELAAAIKKMTSVHSEDERVAIAATLDASPPKPSLIKLGASHRVSAKTIDTLKNKIAKQSGDAKAALAKLGVSETPVETAPFRAKLATDFDSYFKGVPAAAARKKRDALIAEAKVRYAKDPDTLKKLEAYLREEARARGVE